MLEPIILGLLMDGKMSGYDLKKTMDSSVGLFYSASFGSLYPALKRLTNKGQLAVIELDDSKNKKLYELLPAGRKAFLEWLEEPLELSRSELLSKIFFYDHLSEEIRIMRLQEIQFKLANEIGRLETVRQIVSKEIEQLEEPQNYYFRVSVLQYGLNYYVMVQQWLHSIKERKELDHVNSTRTP